MNPLCLLTKGRTFRDFTDRTGTYKLLAGAVPKYSDDKRGPARRWQAAVPPTAQASLFDEAPEAAKPVRADVSDLSLTEKTTEASVVPPQPTPAPASPSPAVPTTLASQQVRSAGPVRQATGFCRKMWQRFIFGREGHPFQGPTVQTELALEKVTVLRNDLNEDDLEVVLVEKKVGKGEKPLARLSKTEMTGDAWSRLTAPFRKMPSAGAINPKAEKAPSSELSARA